MARTGHLAGLIFATLACPASWADDLDVRFVATAKAERAQLDAAADAIRERYRYVISRSREEAGKDAAGITARALEAGAGEVVVTFTPETIRVGREWAASIASARGDDAHVVVGRKFDVGGRVWTYPSAPAGTRWVESSIPPIPRSGEPKPTGTIYELVHAERIEFAKRDVLENKGDETWWFKAAMPIKKYDPTHVSGVFVIVDGKAVQRDRFGRVFARHVQYQVRKGGGFETKTKPADWGHVQIGRGTDGFYEGEVTLELLSPETLAIRNPMPIAVVPAPR